MNLKRAKEYYSIKIDGDTYWYWNDGTPIGIDNEFEKSFY